MKKPRPVVGILHKEPRPVVGILHKEPRPVVGILPKEPRPVVGVLHLLVSIVFVKNTLCSAQVNSFPAPTFGEIRRATQVEPL